MRIVYIPLDERPCNSLYPVEMIDSIDEIKIISFPLEYFGKKKKAADVERLFYALENKIEKGDILVVSMDMLLYGGLIPSRLHFLDDKIIQERLELFERIVVEYDCKVYASNVIMRSPTYNSSDEEPDYYEYYGQALHRSAYLKDKKKTVNLSKEEESELKSYQIPASVQNDYEQRRFFNEKVNMEVLYLLERGIIDYLVIPQDDAQPYGYTAQSQKRVIDKAYELNLLGNVSIYPGADEVGATLCGRAINDYFNKKPRIYPFYSSTEGPFIIPLYEDRPLHETLKSHINAIGGLRVETAHDADVLLAINSPVKQMQRAEEQPNIHFEYHSYRNLKDFLSLINYYLESSKKVVLSDSSFGNGGDIELIRMLDEQHLFDRLSGYSGWNTNGNTLGVALLQVVLKYHFSDYNHYPHLFYRLFEDVLYQSIVRKKLRERKLPSLGYSDGEFTSIEKDMSDWTKKEMIKIFQGLKLSNFWEVDIKNLYFPWGRCFEIGFQLEMHRKK